MVGTCNGLGPVILWVGVLLPVGGVGGSEGDMASPINAVLWLGKRSVGRGWRGAEEVEGGGPCRVNATYVPAMMKRENLWEVLIHIKSLQLLNKVSNNDTHIWSFLLLPDETWMKPMTHWPERHKQKDGNTTDKKLIIRHIRAIDFGSEILNSAHVKVWKF